MITTGPRTNLRCAFGKHPSEGKIRSLRLYHNDMSVCAQKVRFALAEKKLAWEGHHLNLRAGDQQEPEYLKLNPNAVVPTLVDDGNIMVESTVICEYLDDAYFS